ncbi:NAD-dependent epimerase/dehydratase family protein [Kitasatospora sp. DSM 101779]|uniref:Putative NDP-hexose 4-ketoreductase n=1 Tax=Kitasatospora sp. 152608 TaxID=1769566 RepID=A0A0U3BHR0_9ACTN|nr:NAD-dependent epimerase/dehydratase family protein [Kitasatospora sp. DSM 101779]ALT05937.1 putative NDP-hexose 4-ketoreductase [Kitasatospora sp. 152608]MCU7825075.1 sugar nucleotide-binding protein [Kitasatospora sp. DSM 101779]
MEIIGRGFLAGHLAPLAHEHADAVALAAGVSWASGTSTADFERERHLFHQVLDRCRASGRTLIFFSTASAGVYGADRPGREDDAVTARSAYGAHKLGMERELLESGADFLVLRLGHLVGRGQPAHQLLPTLVASLGTGRIAIQRHATRDVIDVAHVVAVIDLLLRRGIRRETLNVASGTAVPVEHVVDHLEFRLGLSVDRRYEDTGTSHLVSVDKLHSLLPEVRGFGFGPAYYRTVLDAYLAGTRGSAEPAP